MRLPKPIEKRGLFWLPTDPEDQLPGILRISDLGEITLEVSGVFGAPLFAVQSMLGVDPPPTGEKPNLNRIVGNVERDGPVTLDACFRQGGSLNFTGALSHSIYGARFAFIGGKYDIGIDLDFSELRLTVEGLEEWLSIHWVHQQQDWASRSGSIEYQLPEDVALRLPNGVDLTFGNILVPSNLSTPITRVSVAQTSYIRLKLKEQQSIACFSPLVYRICSFLSLATDKAVSVSSIIGYLERETENAERPREHIQVYFQTSARSSEKPEIRWHDMLFAYGNIADQCEQVLTKWLEIYDRFEPALDLYFASRSVALRSYVEVRFMRLAQGIETLHRRSYKDTKLPEDEYKKLLESLIEGCPEENREWLKGALRFANEPTLRRRIAAMIKPYQTWFGTRKDSKRLVGLIVDTRNYLTHYDSELPIKESYVYSLVYMCEKLEALFQLHLLRLIGIDTKPIAEGHSKLASRLRLKW